MPSWPSQRAQPPRDGASTAPSPANTPPIPFAPQALWLSARSSLEAGAPPAGVAPYPFDEAVADLLTLASVFPGSSRAADGLAVAGNVWFYFTAPDEALFIYKLPYTETGRYLRRILTHYYRYTRLYPR